MSIIGTIRNKFTWLLLLLVGFAILAFLLMDGSGPNGNLFGANPTVGNIDGSKVKAISLQKRMTELKDLYPNASDDQLRTTAWNDLIDQQIFSPRFEDLGIAVTKEELSELIRGENPHPYARQMFSSLFPDGQYNAAAVNEFLQTNENSEMIVQQLTTAITDAKIDEKYSSLLRNGINAPKWVAEDEFVKEYKTVDFEYVLLPYTLVDDSEITVTDAELREYAEENKTKYASDEGFILQYVSFEQKPSKTDTTNQLVEMQSLKTEFAEAQNPEQFAQSQTTIQPNRNQLAINTNIEFQTKETLNTNDEQADKILNAETGSVVGPFVHNGFAYLTKVLEKTTIADSAKVRHILIETNPADPASYATSKELADSLTEELRTDKSKFNDYVQQYSKDQGSIESDGVYEFFPQGQMVPEFNTAAFNNDLGSIEVVETMFGFHILEPISRKGNSQAVKLATIVKGFNASKETLDNAYNQAKTFERESTSEQEFVANAADYGGIKTTPVIDPNANTISGIGQNFQIIRWANNAKVGDVKYFSNTGNNSIVARLDAKSKAGEIDLEANRVELTNEVKKQKKAEILKQRIEENGGASQELATLASKLGRQVQQATEAKFGASGEGVGYEPEVISRMFFSSEGKIDEVLDGRRGLYVVNVKDFGTLPPENNFEQYKTQFTSSMRSKANVSALISQMKKDGIIKDERYKIR